MDRGEFVVKKPKMIIFDYGQTLIDQERFDGVRGTQAVLSKCFAETYGISAEEIQAMANELNKDIGRFDPDSGELCMIEVHDYPFQNYLYEYFGLTRTVTPLELETIFWDAASPGRPTTHIVELLSFLRDNKIRSAVISNISNSGQALSNRINSLLPQNDFEFILASSEYVFRKPYKRIFELAARKAHLEPSTMWYCGDNALCDVDGATSAGLLPVWYKGAYEGSNNTPSCDCLIVTDWLELIDIILNTDR